MLGSNFSSKVIVISEGSTLFI